MRPLPSNHLRIARPSRDLDRAERFWIAGLGLEVLYRIGADAEGGHALLMLGWPEAPWHLELVGDPNGETPPGSTDEDLLALYVGGPVDLDFRAYAAMSAQARRRMLISVGVAG